MSLCYSWAMDEKTLALLDHIEKVDTLPKFTELFTKTIKRPPHKIKKGTILFNEGDPLGRLYLIKEGFVKIYRMSEEGRETTNYLLGPNYVLGVRALLSTDECARHNAEAITDLMVMTISRKEYFDNVAEHPELLVDLLHVILDRLTYTERKLEGFIFASTTTRVANFLSDIAKRFGKKRDGHLELPLELTHQRIGEFVGAFRETVTLSLHNLEKEKIITIDRGRVTIVNLKKLNQYAVMGRKGK